MALREKLLHNEFFSAREKNAQVPETTDGDVLDKEIVMRRRVSTDFSSGFNDGNSSDFFKPLRQLPVSTKAGLYSLAVIVIILALRVVVNHQENESSSVEIILFGDSLVKYTSETFGLTRHIKSSLEKRHRNFDVTVSESGTGGNCIYELKARMYDDVLDRGGRGPPDAVIMYWDSDADGISCYNRE